jgi:Family of unknown function (DUF6364)
LIRLDLWKNAFFPIGADGAAELCSAWTLRLRSGQAREGTTRLAHIMGFTYYGSVNITLSVDEELVKQVRKIAIERDTTLTGLVRSYLQQLAAEHAKSGRKRRELEALERSFEQLQIRMGKRTWKREDLYERS